MRHPSPRSTLFPYTTLFRSQIVQFLQVPGNLPNGSVDFERVPAHRTEAHGRYPRHLRLHQNLWHVQRSEEHTSELQSLTNLVCRLLLEKKNKTTIRTRCTPH